MAIVDEFIAVLGYDLRNSSDLARFNTSLKNLERSAYNVGRAIGRSMMIASAAVSAGVGFMGGAVLKTNADFEKMETTLETIEGTSAKAKAAMAWVVDFAKTTPFEVNELTAAFVKLRTFGFDPMDGTMIALGDTASAFGASLNDVVEAFADAATFQYTRLKSFGITAEAAGDKVTLNWVENGEKMFETFDKGLDTANGAVKIWTKLFAGAMVRQSKTFYGMLSNINDNWTQFLRRIGEAGFFDVVKNKMADILDLFNEWSDDGTLQRIADNLSGAFIWLADSISGVVQRIARHVAFLSENFKTLEPWVKGLGIAFAGLIVTFNPMIRFFAILALVADDVMTHFEGGKSVFGDLIKFFDELTKFAGPAGSAMSKLALATTLLAIAFVAFNPVTALKLAFVGLTSPLGWALILVGVGVAFALAMHEELRNAVLAQDWSEVGRIIGQSIAEGLSDPFGDITQWTDGMIKNLVGDENWAKWQAFVAEKGLRGVAERALANSQANAPAWLGGPKPRSAYAGDQSTGGRSTGWANFRDNIGKTGAAAAAGAVTTTIDSNNTTTTTVTANVTVNALGITGSMDAAGRAVAGAVTKAVAPTRLQHNPSGR